MATESAGQSRGTPRIAELVKDVPLVGTGKSPTLTGGWPEVVMWLKVAGQPVPGPWPPHQEPRPDPEAESLPVAVRAQRPSSTPTRPASPPRGGTSRSNVGAMDEPLESKPRGNFGYMD